MITSHHTLLLMADYDQPQFILNLLTPIYEFLAENRHPYQEIAEH